LVRIGLGDGNNAPERGPMCRVSGARAPWNGSTNATTSNPWRNQYGTTNERAVTQ
jgi:hypothetical protein